MEPSDESQDEPSGELPAGPKAELSDELADEPGGASAKVMSPLLVARFHRSSRSPRSRGSWGSWRSWPRPDGRWVAAGVLAVGLLVAAVTVATRAWTSTREATERTTASLAATRSDIDRTEGDLATATDERQAAQSTLGDQVAILALRQDERDDAQRDLDVVSLVLARAQGQLTQSQVGLVQSTARLDAFDRCLIGVAQALNQAAVSDTNGLMSTIRRIEGVCAEAGVVL